MKTRLIIFDMDGVLVDACEWHRVALNEALKEVCNYEISLEEHHKEFNGIPTKVKLKILAEKNLIPYDKIKLIEDLKQEKTIDAIQRSSSIKQDKIELMKFLKNKSLNIACYTNSITKTARLMLEKIGIYDFLDFLITNENVTAPKPDAEGYLNIINHFKLKKEQVIIIEDSPKGLIAAKTTGCRVIQVKDAEEVNISLFKDIL
jgi:beta-phosphoglucomutase-like phosphatase (HAD superfamily)